MSDSRNFEEASRQIRENLNRHISKIDNILDEEESDDDSEIYNKFVSDLLTHYRWIFFLFLMRKYINILVKKKTLIRKNACLY